MDHGDGRNERFLLKVPIEASQLMDEEHALVYDRSRRQRTDIGVVIGLLEDTAHHAAYAVAVVRVVFHGEADAVVAGGEENSRRDIPTDALVHDGLEIMGGRKVWTALLCPAFGNRIFRELNAAYKGLDIPPRPSDEERNAMMIRHLEMMCGLKGESTGVKEFRKYIVRYTKGVHGAAAMRRRANDAVSLKEMKEIIQIG